jgi:hypothetical protein
MFYNFFNYHNGYTWDKIAKYFSDKYDHSYQHYERKVRPTKRYADGRQKGRNKNK